VKKLQSESEPVPGWNPATQRMGFDGAPYLEKDENGKKNENENGSDDFIALTFKYEKFATIDSAILTLDLTPMNLGIDTDSLILFADFGLFFPSLKGQWGNETLADLSVGERTTVVFDLSAISTSTGDFDILPTLINRPNLNFIYQDDALIHSATLKISGVPVPEPSSLLLILIGLFSANTFISNGRRLSRDLLVS
jgi:hypothetical protein